MATARPAHRPPRPTMAEARRRRGRRQRPDHRRGHQLARRHRRARAPRRGAFAVGPREIGHLHGDRVAHFGSPEEVWPELLDAGRITHHPVLPGRQDPGARSIAHEDDVADVITLLRRNYDRVVANG
jgi:hypothetical protein